MKRLALTYLPLAASAILLAWSFPGFHLHWLAWVALAPLFLVATKAPPRRAALQFFLCGHVFHTLLLQWLWANIFWAGGWAILGQQGLCLILSVFWGLLGFLWAGAHKQSPQLGGALCLAGLWVGMELFLARAFTGFGWSALGYTQGANLLTAQWAAVGGVSTISFLIVFVNALLALGILYPEGRWKRIAFVPLVLVVVHGSGYMLLKDANYESMSFKVGVAQPNFSQEMKWDPAYDYEMLQRTAQMTRSLAAVRPFDLMVWPEALIVRHFENPVFMEALSHTAMDTQSHIFTGAVRDDYATSKSYNSSALINPAGDLVGTYDKVRLAAFGEYVPFESYLPFLGQIAFGGMSAGETQKTLPVAGRVMGPLICFEVLFAPMAEKLRAMGADMLVVVTNLAWFGGSCAIPQELEIARMRAIETRLPLIHSANTGISGVFDPYGRFTVVNLAVSSSGTLLSFPDALRPRDAFMRRFVGDFALAAPARRPLPLGPGFLPWLLMTVGALLAVGALARHMKNRLLTESAPVPKKKPRKKAVSEKAPAKKAPTEKSLTEKAPQKSGAKTQTGKKAAKQEELPFNGDEEE